MNSNRRTNNSCVAALAAFMVCFFACATMAQQHGHDGRVYAKWTWRDAELKSVFQELSEVGGKDIVVSDNVNGKIDLAVTNKRWQEVLAIVCKLKRLNAMEEGSYIYVMTEDEFQKQRAADASSSQLAEQVGPLTREVIRLGNTTAEEIKASIEGLLSQRGKVTIVTHNNAVIIYDTKENIAQIRAMIRKLDVETQQISISAKIIEVSSGRIQDMGVQWGLTNTINGVGISAKHLPGTNVVAGALERLSYGILGQDKFSAMLEYLLSENKADVVAQPSITTLDNKQARIFMGGQIPLLYRDQAGNTLVKYIEAGTELAVTPHVTDGKRVMLELHAKKESANADKSLQTQDATTNLVVNDGETVVIAGLTSTENFKTEEGIPILKDIPLLGNLFKHSIDQVQKKDLIIFVTPHIIQKDVEAVSDKTAPAAQP